MNQILLVCAEELLTKLDVQGDDFGAVDEIGDQEIVLVKLVLMVVEGVTVVSSGLGDHVEVGSP
jgi:hypothetical protein